MPLKEVLRLNGFPQAIESYIGVRRMAVNQFASRRALSRYVSYRTALLKLSTPLDTFVYLCGFALFGTGQGEQILL